MLVITMFCAFFLWMKKNKKTKHDEQIAAHHNESENLHKKQKKHELRQS